MPHNCNPSFYSGSFSHLFFSVFSTLAKKFEIPIYQKWFDWFTYSVHTWQSVWASCDAYHHLSGILHAVPYIFLSLSVYLLQSQRRHFKDVITAWVPLAWRSLSCRERLQKMTKDQQITAAQWTHHLCTHWHKLTLIDKCAQQGFINLMSAWQGIWDCNYKCFPVQSVEKEGQSSVLCRQSEIKLR